jgi:hypothetical protein
VPSLPEETGREGEGTKVIIGSSCCIFIASLCEVGVGVSGVSIAGSVCVEVKVACDGEGVCPRKTEPKMESGIWRKEPLLVGEAARSGALSWPCLAASAVNMSSSIAPALNPGVTC